MSAIGSTPALIVGTAVGGAAAAAFEPALEVPRQSAWQSAPNRLPDVGLIASLVAGGKVTLADGVSMSQRLGYDQGPFESLVWLAQNRLDFPLMLRMWRLSAVNPDFDAGTLSSLVDETLAHEQVDWDYRPYLRALQTAELPGIGDIAIGVVRGALPAPSYVPVPPPTSGTSVPRFPQVDIDPEKLAAALGYDADMLHLMIARSGLSIAPGLAAQAFFRGLINGDDFTLAIAEGDLRTEWAQTLQDVSRAIPTPGDYAEAQLRGFNTAAQSQAGAARHGMSADDYTLLYDVKGRAPAVHNITTGLARGGTYNGDSSNIPEVYLAAMQRGNIRPEYYSIEYANRYLYPSAFVLRALAQAGELGDEAAVEQILLDIGWEPTMAANVAASWTGGGTTGDTHVAKAQTQLWTTTHSAYKAGEITEADAQTALAAAGVPSASVAGVLSVWNSERALTRKQLSPAQVKKAYTEGTYTIAEAEAALTGRGYSSADAQTLLEE